MGTLTRLSLAAGVDGITQSITMLTLLYVSGMPRVAAASLQTMLWILAASGAVCAVCSAVLTAFPTSYSLLVACKAIEGSASAMYTSYAYILVVRLFPLEYQGQTAATISAGQ